MSKKTAFILMPFAEEFSDIYKHLISDCLQGAGYTVKRADDIKSQRNIIGDIVEGIVESDLIVADLTGANPNVYYELGIAHTLNKKAILLTQEIDELPFDLRSYRVVAYGTHFAKMNQAKKELSELAFEAFNGSLPFGNPVKDFGSINPLSDVAISTVHPSELQVLDEDLGLLDYRVMLEDGFEELVGMVAEVGDKLRCDVTPEITRSTQKLNSGSLTIKQQLNLIKELASSLQEYGVFLKPKNVRFRLLLKDIESALENMLNGSFELRNKEANQELQSFLDTLSNLEDSASDGREGLVSLVDIMEKLPKIEKNFNRAKIVMAAELKTFIDNIDQTISIIARACRLGSSLIKKSHINNMATSADRELKAS